MKHGAGLVYCGLRRGRQGHGSEGARRHGAGGQQDAPGDAEQRVAAGVDPAPGGAGAGGEGAGPAPGGAAGGGVGEEGAPTATQARPPRRQHGGGEVRGGRERCAAPPSLRSGERPGTQPRTDPPAPGPTSPMMWAS